ncbi:MAG: alpha/beta fold hydrolase [Acidimicrobiia bacterium]
MPEPPHAPPLPPGRKVVLPGRGTTFVRELAGPPGAPTILLLHGWTGTADLNWFAAYEPLAARFRVVTLDHRGHGRGIRNGRRFRLADCADDAAAQLDVLGIDRVVACGYSMGGPIASLLWRRHRHRVEGLVLCATAARFARSRAGRARLDLLGSLGAAAQLVPTPLATAATARIVGGVNIRRGLGPWVSEELLLADGRTLLQAGGELGRWDARPWIGEVDVPASVVVTTEDPLVPPDEQRWQAGAVGATVHDVAGHHTVCLGMPERFVPALLAATADVADRLPR